MINKLSTQCRHEWEEDTDSDGWICKHCSGFLAQEDLTPNGYSFRDIVYASTNIGTDTEASYGTP